jgi:hypothetical protein
LQDDLTGIDLLNGCRNTTFQQNVTFGYQDLPSLSKSSAVPATRNVLSVLAVSVFVGGVLVLP